MHKLKMVFAAGIFATLPLSAAHFVAYIHKADGDTHGDASSSFFP